jgi:hypothetical protein
MARALLLLAHMRLHAPRTLLFSLLTVVVWLGAPLASAAQDRDPNINTKYTVEQVEVRGVRQRDVSPELRKELDALTGKPLDTESAEQVVAKLRAAFPGYHIDRRLVRADRKGTIRVIYLLHRPEWARYLRYEPVNANALYHSDQGWGAVLPLGLSGISGDFHVMPIVTWSNADDLIEENSGFGIRVESRRLGTERLGMYLDWSTQNVDWREQTLTALAANPQLASPYRNRTSFTPLLKFAFSRHVSVAGGVGITELDPLADDEDEDALPSAMANVAIGSVRYKQQWSSSARLEHQAAATFTLRKGVSGLESDYVYDRYLGEADYLFRSGRHRVFVSGMAGRIEGDAPLFERFTLGDSRTLRGWDKYDISPAGGDRMFHASLEYRFRSAMLFVDAGSVWNAGDDRRIHFSTGGGFNHGPVFLTVGFPLNTDDVRAVLTMGFRFGVASTGVRKF